ncbi:hypothetical protein LXL04_019911 [Taraxacum kok-saghyz]
MSTSRSKRSRATARSQPNPNHRVMKNARNSINSSRNVEPTRFITTPALTKLHVLDGVRSLFQNIGWAGLFDIAKGYYLKPTTEFLSLVYLSL